MRSWAILLLAVTALTAPVAAQVDDEQTREYERQDQRYLERLQEPEPESEAGDETYADREAFLAKAEELVSDRHFDALVTEHYRLQTDDIRLLLDETGTLFESFQAFFERFWDGRLELGAGDEEPTRVFLLRSFYKYNQLLRGDFRRIEVRPKGHYVRAFDVIVAHTGADLPQQLPDALVHETAHRLIERRLLRGGPPSLWVSEGLASYFGYTYRDRDGEFREGVVGGKSIRLVRDSAPGQSREGIDRLRGFKRAASGLESDFVERLVAIRDPAEFYGPRAELYYAGSWLLVHFLLHGEEGRYAEAFARYLTLDAAGAGPDALYRELGAGPQQLQPALLDHVRRIKTH